MSNGRNPYSKISKLPICITKNCSTSSASRHLERENTPLIIPVDLVHCAIQSAQVLAQPSSPAWQKRSPGLGANLCIHPRVWGRATMPRVVTRRSPRKHVWGSWASHWLRSAKCHGWQWHPVSNTPSRPLDSVQVLPKCICKSIFMFSFVFKLQRDCNTTLHFLPLVPWFKYVKTSF